MTGITRDELMQMACNAGLSFLDGSARAELDDYIDDELIDFFNAILERAAAECEGLPFGGDDERIATGSLISAIRALKINTGD